MLKKIVIIIVFILILIIGIISFIKYIPHQIVIKNNPEINFQIERGSSLNTIYQKLQQHNIALNKNIFKLVCYLKGKENKLQYGRFKIGKNANLSYGELIEILSSKGRLTKNITIPEGSRIIDIASILQRELALDSLEFVEKCHDLEFINSLNMNYSSLEGFLYPQTYNFNENSTIEAIIKKMIQNFHNKIKPFHQEIKASKYSLYEILILASIIQGEVQILDERFKVSTVYNNRLQKKMLLQADPTIQYLYNTPRRLLYEDLESESPYNTYKFKGLPPTPINNPSILMIEAALKPLAKKYLYMVAKGNGEHYFNDSLTDHLKDKKKFDQIRKKIKRSRHGL